MHSFTGGRLLLRSLSALLLLLCACTAQADTALSISERLLGLSEQELSAAVPAATRNAKAVPGPHGSRGLWSLTNAELAGLPFDVTFYFKSKVLERIEQRRRAPDRDCNASYTALVANLSRRYGVAVVSDGGVANEGQSRSAAWVADNFKVLAYRLQPANGCDLMVAIEPQTPKDASEL